MATALEMGSTVRRNVKEALYCKQEGKVIEIDETQGRARVQWSDKKTWYKIDRLIIVK